MKNIKEFGATCRKFCDIADFVTIYIAEAHPYDSGDLSEEYKFKINSHKAMEDRIDAAYGLAKEFHEQNCPILVDYMDDKSNKAYGGYPERLYVLLNGKIEYVGGMGPFGYKVEEINDWLNKYKSRKA